MSGNRPFGDELSGHTALREQAGHGSFFFIYIHHYLSVHSVILICNNTTRAGSILENNNAVVH